MLLTGQSDHGMPGRIEDRGPYGGVLRVTNDELGYIRQECRRQGWCVLELKYNQTDVLAVYEEALQCLIVLTPDGRCSMILQNLRFTPEEE